MSSPLSIERVRAIDGTLRPPGDKSIGHRALIFAGLAEGESRIRGLPAGADVATTRHCLETLGVGIREHQDSVVITGRGWNGLNQAPGEIRKLDCGNAGTTARLLCGLVSGRQGRFRLTGDASLSSRPMSRVTNPLSTMGARVRGGSHLPLEIEGGALRAAALTTEVPSAQVKSALILAALQADGESVIRESSPSRDHTERLLRFMGAPVVMAPDDPLAVRVGGGASPVEPLDLSVPGDPSSAAYAAALACCLPGSELSIEGVCLNPTRLGFYRLLARMGAELEQEVDGEEPEPVGRITVHGGPLHGIAVGGAEIVGAIDEIPLLACVAAIAEGSTVIRGAGELRHKESDRISSTIKVMRGFGIEVDELPDGFRIAGGSRPSSARVNAHGDHRIAMCAVVLGSLAGGPSELSGHEWIDVSYPEFLRDLGRLSV